MGIDSGLKAWLVAIYGEGAVSDQPPQGISVHIFDNTAAIKFLTRPYKNGYEYFHAQFLLGASTAFASGARIVYCILDRGSPENKSMEHAKRAKSTIKMKTPENDSDPSLVNDFRIPKPGKDGWKSFIANRYLSQRLVYYLTMRLIGTRGDIHPDLKKFVEDSPVKDFDDKLPDYTVPPGGNRMLCLFGGRLQMPDSNRPLRFKHPEPALITLETITRLKQSKEGISQNLKGSIGMNDTGGYETVRSVQVSTSGPGYNEQQLNNLLEGEVSCMFFALNHIEIGESVIIYTPDGDTLMMLLLSTPDRIDRITGQFICNVYVCLSAGAKKQYVDVHKLWYNMYVSRPSPPPDNFDFFANRDSYEFVSKLCSIGILCGTDYFKNYCVGIGLKTDGIEFDVAVEVFSDKFFCGMLPRFTGREIPNYSQTILAKTPVPWVIYVFLKYYHSFGNFVSFKRNKKPNWSRSVRKSIKVDVDEDKFIEFTRAVYMEKHGRSKKFESTYSELNYENMRKYLNEDKKEELQKRLIRESKKTSDAKRCKVTTKVGGTTFKTPNGMHMVTAGSKVANPIDVEKCNALRKANRIPSKRQIRVFSRQFLWQLLYYCNSYRGSCSLLDPTTLYKDLPYYGFVIDEKTGLCTYAERVSIKCSQTSPEKEKKQYDRLKHELEQNQTQSQMTTPNLHVVKATVSSETITTAPTTTTTITTTDKDIDYTPQMVIEFL